MVQSERLAGFPWIDRYRPWGISPISLLEIQFLAEIGRLDLRNPEFWDAVMADPRFVVDEPPMLAVVRHAIALDWTRDPFDRLLAAHSTARRIPLISADQRLREHHRLIAAELL